ncbi:MAG: ABC transporter permease [Planctomycetaceae bacterium]|nr:ABC transporter permease [Planctomycetaceae bacterium]
MFRFALKNLLSRPVRSLLALCGLTVAIAGMVGLFSVAEGIEDTVSTTFGKVPGLTVMQPGAPIPLFSRIPAGWGDEIRAVKGVHVVHPEVWSRAHVIDGKPTISPPRFLFGSDLKQADRLRYSVYREGIKEGRALTAADRGTHNALVSRAIAEEFKKTIGETLRVDGRDCEIVGIYEAQSLFLDVAIILDIDLVRSMARVGPESVSNFYVEPDQGADRKQLADSLKALFRGRAPDSWQPAQALATELAGQKSEGNPLSGLIETLGGALLNPPSKADAAKADTESSDGDSPAERPGVSPGTLGEAPGNEPPRRDAGLTAELPVEIRSPEDWAGEFKRFSQDLDVFLLLMTSIGVTIAFVGIVNTMLMSVTERFIEFGILKANGWSSGEVLRLIAFESALLGLAGGIVGSIVGWIATLVINAHWPTRIHLYASPSLLLFSLAFSTILGVLGGLYPALRAARMMPMDAIRRG